MQKRGKTAAGTQRWYCSICSQSAVRTRPDVTLHRRTQLFIYWLTSTDSLVQLATRNHLSIRTLQSWFEPLWQHPPTPRFISCRGVVLILDATWLAPRQLVCCLGRTTTQVVFWLFASSENYASWSQFCRSVEPPRVVVCDGQRGMLAAIRQYWPETQIQRCVIHVVRLARIRLTSSPKSQAGRDLSQIVSGLLSVRTRRQKRRWLRSYRRWEKKYDRLLAERSHGLRPGGKRTWWYTHKSLRAARSVIHNSLPHIFTYIGHPEVPRTTNHVEGGINARLKELIHRHRGLSLARKMVLTAWFLHAKQTEKPPRNCH